MATSAMWKTSFCRKKGWPQPAGGMKVTDLLAFGSLTPVGLGLSPT